jgi:hypothetical protein
MSHVMYREEARHEWDQAHRKAIWTRLKSYVLRQDVRLQNFEDVARRLQLRSPRYKGVQEIAIDAVVGSVGRYHDFVASFLPVSSSMQDRWQGVARAFLDPTSGGVPPIEVYKVGGSYFVKDGNHRVSVARQLGITTIDAYVWEYPIPVGDDLEIDCIIIEMERRDFLEATGIANLRPQHDIEFTVPGGYPQIYQDIICYQQILEQIDGEPKSLEESVTAWYDMIYEPSVLIIEEHGVLEHFSERTPADLFIFMHNQQRELEKRYGHSIRVTQAIREMELQQVQFLKRWWRQVRGWLPFGNSG